MPLANDALKVPAAPLRWPWQRRPLAVALLLLAGLAALLARDDLRMAGLFLLGAALGVTLYHAAFGFTGAYRRLITERDTRGVRAQLVMLGAATLLFAPVLAAGSVFGREVAGALAPVGWQVAAGAFLFGIGMQLGNGCGSGTLFTLGGGSTRMLATLAAFVAGSFWASLDMGWWQALPSLPPIALGAVFGWPLAVALQIALLLVLWLGLKRWGKPAPENKDIAVGWRIMLTGPWPLLAGALALAGLNFITLLIAGHPWTITWAFTLWGAKIAMLLGWNPASSAFWQGDFQQAALQDGILDDITSVMDIGLLVGALCAAALAGRFAPRLQIPLRSLIAALLGGLLMGYGARIAFGCNVGAFFSGVASTSLHGWLWIAAALPGNWIGVRLRPLFRMPN
ncbi:MAG: YeeE/YedE family protein [Oxalobacteraceae bacterium]|nr:YeeE/YedE family protein [Oxalobacteraceae bacterium]